MIRAALFDVGGVLHSSEGEYVRKDIAETLGITEEQCVAACEKLQPALHLGKITEAEFWQQFIQLTGAPNPLPEESLWAREFTKRYTVFTDTLDIVEKLKQRGIRVAILSNTMEPHAKVNRQMGIYDPFPDVILSHEVSLAKPDPAMYKLALDRLQVAPEETLFIDDLPENVAAARDVGMHGIVFQNAKQLRQELVSMSVV